MDIGKDHKTSTEEWAKQDKGGKDGVVAGSDYRSPTMPPADHSADYMGKVEDQTGAPNIDRLAVDDREWNAIRTLPERTLHAIQFAEGRMLRFAWMHPRPERNDLAVHSLPGDAIAQRYHALTSNTWDLERLM